MDGIIVFTDGASRGNPGPGGWGAVVVSKEDKVVELGGREDNTTNNRMELKAVLSALTFIEERKLEGVAHIHTDSAYVLQGITGWVYGWEKNGWKTKAGEDVLNQDIWRELGAIAFRMKARHRIEWIKVSGHVGHRGNERADYIATNQADKGEQMLFVGSLESYEALIGGSLFDFEEGSEEKKQAKKKSSKLAYSYVSSIGGIVETHKTWPECESRVKGKRGAKFKKVFSIDEERELVDEWKKHHSN